MYFHFLIIKRMKWINKCIITINKQKKFPKKEFMIKNVIKIHNRHELIKYQKFISMVFGYVTYYEYKHCVIFVLICS